jgi:hypothetical protein
MYVFIAMTVISTRRGAVLEMDGRIRLAGLAANAQMFNSF